MGNKPKEGRQVLDITEEEMRIMKMYRALPEEEKSAMRRFAMYMAANPGACDSEEEMQALWEAFKRMH